MIEFQSEQEREAWLQARVQTGSSMDADEVVEQMRARSVKLDAAHAERIADEERQGLHGVGAAVARSLLDAQDPKRNRVGDAPTTTVNVYALEPSEAVGARVYHRAMAKSTEPTP